MKIAAQYLRQGDMFMPSRTRRYIPALHPVEPGHNKLEAVAVNINGSRHEWFLVHIRDLVDNTQFTVRLHIRDRLAVDGMTESELTMRMLAS